MQEMNLFFSMGIVYMHLEDHLEYIIDYIMLYVLLARSVDSQMILWVLWAWAWVE